MKTQEIKRKETNIKKQKKTKPKKKKQKTKKATVMVAILPQLLQTNIQGN